jgi:glycosyltransferase involved in cell wall biosynthesis
LFRSLAGANIVLQRRLLPGWQLSVLRRAAHLLVFDFDDAIFLRDSFSSKGLLHKGRQCRFAATVRTCDAVVAGNSFLAAQASTSGPRSCVRVIPTCVDPVRYPLYTAREKLGAVQLVWVGSASTLRGLQSVAPLLEQLGQQVPGLQLKLICDRFIHLDHLAVVPRIWSEETEAEDIARADIGISWMPNDLWSRGKCGLKVLQYMAAGLPVVANPVGVHVEMIRHGETGFLAETPAQWSEAIALLAGDPRLRTEMGCAGRLLLETHYSVATGATCWLALLDQLAQRQAQTG